MNDNTYDKAKKEKIEALAFKVLGLSRDTIAMHLRFLNAAIAALTLIPKYDIAKGGNMVGGGMATDGEYIYFDPVWVLKTYEAEPERVTRTYLHLLLHLVFFHPFNYEKIDRELWDVSADAAVEAVILSLGLFAVSTKRDSEAEERLKILRREAGGLTAEKIYRYFRINGMSEAGKREFFVLFHKDEHIYWREKKEIKIIMEKWQKISERVRTENKSFSGGKLTNEEMDYNLKEATKERYDYGEMLSRFMTTGEDMRINDDEFDYIYYTYGLENYGNMPLVEPLEYKDDNRIKDFVIAIDTSASTKGEVVKNFLKKTYNILKSNDNFFTKVNIHIIQNDNRIREDTKITDRNEFDKFCESIKIKGFGSTDFRPVFSYVNELLVKGEFDDLKGLIYFTDGYGTYPEEMPSYDVLFAFLKEDEYAPKIPPWAYKIILEPEEFEKEDDDIAEELKMSEEQEMSENQENSLSTQEY